MPRDGGDHAATTTALLTGDALERLRELPDESVHACVTSPPYFGLRDYGIDGQIGLEDTPESYVTRLTEVFREVRRVLRGDGTCWIVIGDSYANNGGTGRQGSTSQRIGRANVHAQERASSTRPPFGCKPGDLIGIPEMLFFALRGDGWYVRSRIVWAKSSVMPESVRNRPSSAHETVLMLTKSSSGTFWWHRDGKGSRAKPPPDWRWVHVETGEERAWDPGAKGYRRANLWSGEANFYDREAVAETPSDSSLNRISQATFASQTGGAKDYGSGTNANRSARKTLENFAANPTRNLRNAWPLGDEADDLSDWWTVNPEPLRDAHFAAFPTRLASRCIQASTSEHGCCTYCGAPYRRVVELGEADEDHRKACGADGTGAYSGESRKDYGAARAQDASATKARILAGMRRRRTVGWASTCACPPGPVLPALVLDPFSGAGTVALCASRLGRDCVGIDLNPEYHAIAEKRLADPGAKCLDTHGGRLPFAAATVVRG